MLFVGIDPGHKGGIATLSSDTGWYELFEMPIIPVMRSGNKRERIDYVELGEMFRKFKEHDAHILVEELWGFGQMKEGGEKGQWEFATGYGMLLGAIGAALIPHTLVPPQTWQKIVGKRGKEKIYSIERAIQLFPGVKLKRQGGRIPSDGLAEALLIAYYGKLTIPTT